jgi:hypothetical protein
MRRRLAAGARAFGRGDSGQAMRMRRGDGEGVQEDEQSRGDRDEAARAGREAW